MSWIECLLGDVLTFQRGYDITKKQQVPGEYAVISSSGPGSTHNQYKVKGPGVVVGRKGSLGTVFYSGRDFWPHDTTLWVKDFHGNDEKFAYYFLQTLHFEQYDCGASNPALNRNHIHMIPVLYPPLPTQRKIASILSAYDDLIENNTRRIEILEDMARAIYNEWFVNFRFPCHEKVKMVDSELGPMPEGWEVKSYKELLKLSIGGDWGTEEPDDGHDTSVAVIRGADFVDVQSGKFEKVPRRLISSSSYQKRALRSGDIIVENSVNAASRCSGRSMLISDGIIRSLGGKVICASFCRLFRLADMRLAPLVLQHLRSLYSEGKMAFYQVVAANGIGNFQSTRFVETEGVAIPAEGSYAFDLVIYTLSGLTTSVYSERIRVLRQTRDLLLTKLISGEVDVSELQMENGRAV